MIPIADWIAIYGAGLATIVAIVQLRQWLREEKILTVTTEKEFTRPPNNLEITITNDSQVRVYLAYIGLGYGYRPWPTPWQRRHFESISMKGMEGDFLSNKGAGGWLKPGKCLEAHADRDTFAHVTKPSRWRGFDARLCVWIDHSKADKSYCKVVQ